MKAKDRAQGKWKAVLAELGIDPALLDGRHHPCPKGAGTDRFRFSDREGTGNYFCACSDGRSGGMSLVMCCTGMGYAEAAREVERVVTQCGADPVEDRPDPRIALNRLRERLQPAGFAVQRYLRERGLPTPTALRQARWAYFDGRTKIGTFDVMVALVQSADGRPQAYHLTYLDGVAKANVPSPRKVMTPVETVKGAAIRLYPQAPEIGIAEGIETAIAAHLLTGMPVWSVITAGGVESFQPPKGVESVKVFGDTDGSFTGQAAAYACAKRLTRCGVACEVRMPDSGDWNDVLRRSA